MTPRRVSPAPVLNCALPSSIVSLSAPTDSDRGPLHRRMAALEPGDHACVLYEADPANQMHAVGPFIAAGVEANERVIYVVDDQSVADVEEWLRRHGVPVADATADGRLKICTRAEWRQPGELDSRKKARQFRTFVREAKEAGFAGIRFAVEMTWALGPAIELARLEHWEATINTLLDSDFPIRIICQYNRTRMEAAAIVMALHTHPLIVEGDDVHRNPFYQAPLVLEQPTPRDDATPPAVRPDGEESDRRKADWMLAQLRGLTEIARQREGQRIRADAAKRAMEVQKRRSDELCRAIVESSRDCIKTLTLDGVLLSINEAARELLCIDDLSTLVGRSWVEFWNADDRDAAQQAVNAAAAGGKGRFVGRFDVRGRARWWDVMITPIRGLDEHPEKLLAVSRDVTAMRLAEADVRAGAERLRRSDSLFRQLADSMPQMVWAAGPDGVPDYYNRRWYDFTGGLASPDGANWRAIVHPDDLARSQRAYDDAMRGQTPYEFEFRLKHRASGAYRWFLMRAVPVRDEDGRVIRWFGTCTDIDEQKRAEERLEHAVVERTETLRATIAELEAFSYSISHDLRGPLRSMQGFAEIIEEDFGPVLGVEGCGYLLRIRAAANRMDRLIQDVLTLSRAARANLALEPVDLDPLVRGILESYPNLRARNARIHIEGRLPLVQANQAALTQCFSNLLGNAVKFVREGRTPDVHIWSEPREGRVRIGITDNGIGIPPEAHERIFRMFERLDEGYDGTGIGLAIVKTTISRLGGEVGLESVVGQGSTFWIELRPAEPTSAGVAGAGASA